MSKVLLSLILLFIVTGSYSQQTEPVTSSLYFNVEPLLWGLGEKGASIEYSLNDKILFQFSLGYQSWWSHNNQIQQFDNTYISDYLLASKGWVIRFSPAIIISKNEFSFSEVLIKPELAYKRLSYDSICFFDGPNGIGDIPRQLRSFNSNFFIFNAIFSYRNFGSSYEEIPIEWFIGPGIGLAFEEMNRISEGNSGNCTDIVLDEHTSESKLYYSLRFGLRFGFKIFESKN